MIFHAAALNSQSKIIVDPSSRYALICDDAKSALKDCPNGNFGAVITSPPYWGLRSYGINGEIGSEETLEEYLSSLVEVFRDVRRVLRDDGVMWLVIGDAYTAGHRRYRAVDRRFGPRGMSARPKTPKGLKPKELIGLPWRLAFALQEDGWYLRTDVVWAKPNPMPESVRDRPHRSHEFIFLLSKCASYYFDYANFENLPTENGKFGRSVWNVSVGIDRRGTGHPAAFPIDLVVPCLMSSVRPNDLVLDPFCGSASVGVACLNTGRRFVGIDIAREFVEQAHKSLARSNEISSLNGL